jgi:hypothetical protein
MSRMKLKINLPNPFFLGIMQSIFVTLVFCQTVNFLFCQENCSHRHTNSIYHHLWNMLFKNIPFARYNYTPHSKLQ